MSNESRAGAEANSAWESPSSRARAIGGRPHRRRRRLRGAARPAARARPHAEGRHREDLRSLALVDQYLPFIAEAQKAAARACRRLPRDGGLARLPEVAPAAAARDRAGRGRRARRSWRSRLSFRLMRLDAMREAAAAAHDRKRLGATCSHAACPRASRPSARRTTRRQIYDLLRAYADQRRRTIKVGHVVKARTVWSIKDARERLERLMAARVGRRPGWQLDVFLRAVSRRPPRTAAP